jgi:hypothetical protein
MQMVLFVVFSSTSLSQDEQLLSVGGLQVGWSGLEQPRPTIAQATTTTTGSEQTTSLWENLAPLPT